MKRGTNERSEFIEGEAPVAYAAGGGDASPNNSSHAHQDGRKRHRGPDMRVRELRIDQRRMS